LLDTGSFIYLFVCRGVPEQVLYELFEVTNVDDLLPIEQLPNNPEFPYNQRLNDIIDQLRRNKYGAY
jgi:hypothetical protein